VDAVRLSSADFLLSFLNFWFSFLIFSFTRVLQAKTDGWFEKFRDPKILRPTHVCSVRLCKSGTVKYEELIKILIIRLSIYSYPIIDQIDFLHIWCVLQIRTWRWKKHFLHDVYHWTLLGEGGGCNLLLLASESHKAMFLTVVQVGPHGGDKSRCLWILKCQQRAKELVLMEFGDANRSQRSDILILLCQQEPKVGSFTLIGRQSQRSVPHLVASNSCQSVALYSAKRGIVSRFKSVTWWACYCSRPFMI